MSIKSIVKINEGIEVNGRPKGWVVREFVNKNTNKTILEFGIYVDKNKFVGVPIHYEFKDKFIPTNKMEGNEEYTYYLLPNEIEFGLSKIQNKKSGKMMPILVPVSDNHPAVKIACIGYSNEPESILNAYLKRVDSISIRDYIDKERKLVVIIAACNDSNIINPSIELRVNSGVIGAKTINSVTFNVSMSSTIDKDTITLNKPAETRFIRFKRFITQPKTEKPVEENTSDETKNNQN